MSALVWSPFATKEDAQSVARTLLSEDLIGCANIIGGIESVFKWGGQIDTAQEFGVLFKTDQSLLEKLVQRLEELHPYDTPAILGWKCDEPGVATEVWLSKLARDGGGDGGDSAT